jgi:hypothetical protein
MHVDLRGTAVAHHGKCDSSDFQEKERVINSSNGAPIATDDEVLTQREVTEILHDLCSECARVIDLAEGNHQQRHVQGADFVHHYVEEHAFWVGSSRHKRIVKRR